MELNVIEKTLPLTDAALVLATRGTPVSYRALWGAAIEGKIPATRNGRRWMVKETDLDGIVNTLTSA